MPRSRKPPTRISRLTGDWTQAHVDAAFEYALAVVRGEWEKLYEGSQCPFLVEELLAAFVAENGYQNMRPGDLRLKFHVFRRKSLKSWTEWVETLGHEYHQGTTYIINAGLHEILNQNSPFFENLTYVQIREAIRLSHHPALSGEIQ